jgi:hypothetical protein
MAGFSLNFFGSKKKKATLGNQVRKLETRAKKKKKKEDLLAKKSKLLKYLAS